MKKLNIALIFLLYSILSSIYSQSGSVDLTFGTDGAATYTDLNQRPEAHSIQILANGDIITLGHRQSGFGSQLQMLGYHDDGTRNQSFGGQNLFGNPTWGYPGIINTDFANLQWEHITSSAIQTDGKIVIGGYAGINFDWLVARYKADGSIDSTFNSIGYISEDAGGFELVAAIQLDAMDNIIAFGEVNNMLRIIKYADNGTVDASFGDNGITTIPLNDVHAHAMATTTNGKLYVLGRQGSNNSTTIIVSRINENGTIDPSFGTNGITAIEMPNTLSSQIHFALLPNGQPVIAADATPAFSSISNLFLVKLNVNGTIDLDFGNSGTLTYALGDHVTPHAIMSQTNGKILVCGRLVQSNIADMFVSKLNTDGSFDTSFGLNGIAVSGFATDLSNNAALAYAINQQVDGKILLGGFIKESGIQKSALVRLNNIVDSTYSATTNHTKSAILKLFPNPFTDENVTVYVPFGKWKHLTISSVQGSQIHTQLISPDEKEIILPSILFDKGVSVIQLTGEVEIIYGRIVRS